jgi:hypothetical protein
MLRGVRNSLALRVSLLDIACLPLSLAIVRRQQGRARLIDRIGLAQGRPFEWEGFVVPNRVSRSEDNPESGANADGVSREFSA